MSNNSPSAITTENAVRVQLPPSRTQLAAAADRARNLKLHKRFLFILVSEMLVTVALSYVLFYFTNESLVLWLIPMLILFIAFPIQSLRHILLVYEGNGIGAYEAINMFREQLRRRNDPELTYECPPTYETAREEPPAYGIETTDTNNNPYNEEQRSSDFHLQPIADQVQGLQRNPLCC